ncbi:MAG: HAD family hydrolase [Pseudomonadales bacterium]|nr:HAD family hydrolase [Pseudomonadales bacterium]
MTFKALAIDLDGTLLVGEDLPEDNITALRAARDAGLQIIIATARWIQMAQRVEARIGLHGPAIACSGAQVHIPDLGRDIFDERLPEDFVEELYELCDTERCIATITVEDRVLVKLEGAPAAGSMPPEMHFVRQLRGADPSRPRVANIQGSGVYARIRGELEPRYRGRVNFFDSIGPSGKTIMTLTSANASKGEALKRACAYLELDPSEVITFGDAENDIEMFRISGASVAMGQADERTRAAATFVTARNDEAGVARAVERLLATGRL